MIRRTAISALILGALMVMLDAPPAIAVVIWLGLAIDLVRAPA